jgi:hypothetical protein
MNKCALVLCVGFLGVWIAGCGSSSSSSFTPTGNFTNANFKGQYAYQLNGVDLSVSPSVAYVRAGVLTADGNGNINAGLDDFSEGTPLTDTAFSGTYSIANDGTGSASLTFPTGTLTLALTLVSSSKVYIVEGDLLLTGGGVALLQTTSAFANPPSGTFVFRDHNENSSLGPIGAVGAMTVTAGVVSGSEDVNQAGRTLSAWGQRSCKLAGLSPTLR